MLIDPSDETECTSIFYGCVQLGYRGGLDSWPILDVEPLEKNPNPNQSDHLTKNQ